MSVKVTRLSPAAWLGLFAASGLVLVAVQSDALAQLWSVLLLEIQSVQRDLHRELASTLRAVKTEGVAAAWSLVALSFLYGIFHAAGPGHGKVVISTYLLTQESQLKRGLVLSFVASLCQGVTAIVLVTGCVGLLGFSMRYAQRAASELEMMSYGLVALIGAVLVMTRGKQLLKRRSQAAAQHEHAVGHSSHDAHHHGSGHDHGETCSSCGHAHGPSRKELEQAISWRGLAGMIASVGLRPCSGAILVLLVAHALDLSWAGVVAVLAMSLGTAITVSALATLSVYARQTSLRFAELLPDHSSRIGSMIDFAGLIGGLIILVVGLALFHAAWTLPAHPLF